MEPPTRPPSNNPPAAMANRPLAPPLYLTSVWQCDGYDQAQRAMDGLDYVYQRQGHPNADQLSAELARWHEAPKATVTASGMAALSLAAVARLRQGDHVLLSDRLYGMTQRLWQVELARLGISSTLFDTRDVESAAGAIDSSTRLVVVETIANPMLEVVDLSAMSALAHHHGAELLVDNTLASPWACRPMQWGADLVVESLTKMINGHSDVILGGLCGREQGWDRVVAASEAWGWTASPLSCWLALRGMATLEVRMQRAMDNALRLARALVEHPAVVQVHYPGLEQHPQHELACRQFGRRFGALVTCRLAGEEDPAARRFLAVCGESGVPFAPSLGEYCTTVSHPASTSHRGLADSRKEALGITPGVLRISVGIEPWEELWLKLEKALGTSGP